MSGSNVVRRRGRAAFFWASGGVGCAVALLPAAFLAPFYSGESVSSEGAVTTTTNTLVGVNGLWIVGVLCAPVLLALTAWVGLRLRCSRRYVLGSRLTWSAIALLCAFATVGIASIGLLVMPSALLLIVGARLTPSGPVATGTA